MKYQPWGRSIVWRTLPNLTKTSFLQTHFPTVGKPCASGSALSRRLFQIVFHLIPCVKLASPKGACNQDIFAQPRQAWPKEPVPWRAPRPWLQQAASLFYELWLLGGWLLRNGDQSPSWVLILRSLAVWHYKTWPNGFG